MTGRPRFLVRLYWVNSAIDPEDVDCGPLLGAAIDYARKRATEDQSVRSATVTDDGSMIWAQFNLLWNIPEDAR